MKTRCKLSGLKLNMQKLSILSPNIHRINTHSNNTLNKRGAEIFEVENNTKEEEDMVEE